LKKRSFEKNKMADMSQVNMEEMVKKKQLA